LAPVKQLLVGLVDVRSEQIGQGGDRHRLVSLIEGDVACGLEGQARIAARPVARRDGVVLAAGPVELVVRRHGLCPVRPETSALGVDIDDSIAARSQGLQRRFLSFFLSDVSGPP
jgi:hypothetical protein